jgi:hypothetical protein
MSGPLRLLNPRPAAARLMALSLAIRQGFNSLDQPPA